MAAVRSVNIDIAVYEIGTHSSLTDGEAILRQLKHLETRSDWPQPAREAALFEFTRSLAGLPRTAVAEEVMQHLQNYQAQTLVPHEDHGDTLVPLFNIRGATAGIEHAWQRTEFATDAATLLETNPEIGRPLDDLPELRELVIAFGDSGYVTLYRYESSSDTVYILAFRHQKEAGY